MEMLTQVLPIVVFTILAAITSRILENKATKPEMHWVLLAWAINISVYYLVKEALERSVIESGIVFVITSFVTYNQLINTKHLYSALLSIPSTLALVSILAYFGEVPILSGQGNEVSSFNTYTKEACQCRSVACINDIYLSISPKFMESESWPEKENQLNSCRLKAERKERAIVKTKLLNNKNLPTTVKVVPIAKTEHPTDIQEVLGLTITKSEIKQLKKKAPTKSHVVTITNFNNLSSLTGQKIRISQKNKKPIKAKFISDSAKEIKVKVFLRGGYYVIPIIKKNLRKIEVDTKYGFKRG